MPWPAVSFVSPWPYPRQSSLADTADHSLDFTPEPIDARVGPFEFMPDQVDPGRCEVEGRLDQVQVKNLLKFLYFIASRWMYSIS